MDFTIRLNISKLSTVHKVVIKQSAVIPLFLRYLFVHCYNFYSKLLLFSFFIYFSNMVFGLSQITRNKLDENNCVDCEGRNNTKIKKDVQIMKICLVYETYINYQDLTKYFVEDSEFHLLSFLYIIASSQTVIYFCIIKL